MAGDHDVTPRRRRALRWAEFAALFVAVPVGIALFLPPRAMFPALFAFTVLGLIMLALTGFDWRGMMRGWGNVRWRRVVLMGVVTAAVGIAVLWLFEAGPIRMPGGSRLRLLAMIWLLYPFLSALPQELIFRALYFHRYGDLFPQGQAAILINAAVFSLAHLMYWSVVVAVLTFGGGALFARAYLQRGFPAAWMLHAIAGNVLFAVGMGAYFWSGNVVRPF